MLGVQFDEFWQMSIHPWNHPNQDRNTFFNPKGSLGLFVVNPSPKSGQPLICFLSLQSKFFILQNFL